MPESGEDEVPDAAAVAVDKDAEEGANAGGAAAKTTPRLMQKPAAATKKLSKKDLPPRMSLQCLKVFTSSENTTLF